MKQDRKEIEALSQVEAAKIITELQGEMKLRENQLANVAGALQIAFMRGMAHATAAITDDMRGGLGGLGGLRRNPKARKQDMRGELTQCDGPESYE